MDEISITNERDNRLDVLSMIAAIAESWIVLIIGPIVVGVIVSVLLSAQPARYESRTLVRLGGLGNIVASSVVLRPVVEKLGLEKEAGSQIDQAVDNLAARLRIKLVETAPGAAGDKEPLSEISFVDQSPAQAQRVLQEIIVQVFRQSIPRDGDRENLEASLESLRQASASLNSYSAEILKKAEQVPPGIEATDYTRSVASLVSDIQSIEEKTRLTERTLRGFGAERIVQQATQPDTELPRNRRGKLLLAIMATAFVLLVFVLLRDAYRHGMKDSVTAAKLSRISGAFSFRRRRAKL